MFSEQVGWSAQNVLTPVRTEGLSDVAGFVCGNTRILGFPESWFAPAHTALVRQTFGTQSRYWRRMVFESVLDVAARIDQAAVAEKRAAIERWRRANPAKRARDVQTRGEPLWAAWWYEFGRPHWPTAMLLDSPMPPQPRWSGAGWSWDGGPSLLSGHGPVAELHSNPARFNASAFLTAVNWDRAHVDTLAFAGTYRVSAIAQLALDAVVDEALAEFPGTTATQARKALTAAEQKRAVAGDIEMSLNRMPESWLTGVLNPSIAGGLSVGKW